MDREQEDMQFLGLFGIYKEAYKIIFTCRKILSQITLALILPLSFIFLAHIEISHRLFWKIQYTEFRLHRATEGSQSYRKNSDLLSSEWTVYILFKAAYFTFLLVFSLLSTSAVVYTIASIYTGRDVTFKKVMSVVPKVWKRLMVTFLIMFLAFFAYHVIAFAISIMIVYLIVDGYLVVDGYAGPALFIIVFILYIVGFVYMTIIWQLASVVTVLEDLYGVKAMMKSKDLIKGKVGVASVIFFKLNLSLLVIQILFWDFVVDGRSLDTWKRVGFGILCFLLLFKLILFGLVIQTIIYFVCKSYHHENIDKSSLSDHLEVYLGEYKPLKSKDVQLEQYQV